MYVMSQNAQSHLQLVIDTRTSFCCFQERFNSAWSEVPERHCTGGHPTCLSASDGQSEEDVWWKCWTQDGKAESSTLLLLLTFLLLFSCVFCTFSILYMFQHFTAMYTCHVDAASVIRGTCPVKTPLWLFLEVKLLPQLFLEVIKDLS